MKAKRSFQKSENVDVNVLKKMNEEFTMQPGACKNTKKAKTTVNG